MIYAIMAQIIGKEVINFLLCPLRGCTPVVHTLADNDANKDSALSKYWCYK
ncbi:MAG: hypothetical protein WAU61_01410 [Smithella sp.]